MTILSDMRSVLGIEPDCDEFDTDLLLHINSSIMTLSQIIDVMLPEVDASTEWAALCSVEHYQAVRTWLSLELRIVFDPPATSFALSAIQDKATELLWRLEAEWERTE